MLVILLLSIVSGIAIILPAKDIIWDPYGRGRSRIKPGGIILIIAVILLIILPVIQFKIQEDEQIKRNGELKRGYDSSLVEIKKKFDSTSFKSDSIIADNLGKYGYRFDSASNRLEKIIRDSSKTRIEVGDNPILQISPFQNSNGIELEKHVNGMYTYMITLASYDAASTNIDIAYSFVSQDSTNQFTYQTKSVPVSITQKIAKGNASVSFIGVPDNPPYTFLYIWARGKYSNSDNTKSYNFDEVYYYNVKGNTFGTIKGDTRKFVVAIVREKEK